MVARFLRRAVQVLDRLVASFAKPLALYWRLRRVGAADTGVPPLEGRGSGRCPTGTCSTSGHSSGSGGISAQNLVVIGLFGISAELEHCDRPVSVSGYLSSLSIERRRLRSTSCGPQGSEAAAAVFRDPPCLPESHQGLEGIFKGGGGRTCVVCECLVILNPYIYLAVGAAPLRKRGGVFPPAVFGGCPPPVLLSRVAA